MKKPILYFVLLLSTNFLLAQGSLIFNPDVPNVTNGMVDFTFDLVGGGAEYNLSVEVSFDNGVSWADIPAGAITGNLNNVVPATGIALQWDALASSPGQVTNDARLRVTARHVCGTDFTFEYADGNTYNTVLIGDQCWFKENLRVTSYNNGDVIPTDLDNTDWSNTTEGAYAIYPHGIIDGLDSDAEVVEAYGKLYNWYAVDDSRGLCPEGWSVPSDDDWTQLVDYVVSQGYPNDDWDDPNGAANALKSCRQVNSPEGGDCDTSEHPRWHSDGTHHGFDEFGFSALPGGNRWNYDSFYDVGDDGYWWSATEGSGTSAWSRSMFSGYSDVFRYDYDKRKGFSVRCLRDLGAH